MNPVSKGGVLNGSSSGNKKTGRLVGSREVQIGEEGEEIDFSTSNKKIVRKGAATTVSTLKSVKRDSPLGKRGRSVFSPARSIEGKVI